MLIDNIAYMCLVGQLIKNEGFTVDVDGKLQKL